MIAFTFFLSGRCTKNMTQEITLLCGACHVFRPTINLKTFELPPRCPSNIESRSCRPKTLRMEFSPSLHDLLYEFTSFHKRRYFLHTGKKSLEERQPLHRFELMAVALQWEIARSQPSDAQMIELNLLRGPHVKLHGQSTLLSQ